MDKEFDDWLKGQVSDIPIVPTKEDTITAMLEFAEGVLKAKSIFERTFGTSVPDTIVLSMIKKTLDDMIK